MADNQGYKSVSKIRTFRQDYERIKGAPNTENKLPTKVNKNDQKSNPVPSEQKNNVIPNVQSRGHKPLSSLHKKQPRVIAPVSSWKKPTNITDSQSSDTEQTLPKEVQKNQTSTAELSKEINSQLNQKNVQISVASHASEMPQVADDITSGNIITDTKKDRFKLLPAIWSGLKEWATDSKQDIQQKLEPKEKVTPGSTRTEVIKQAASGSALAPQDDYAKVSQRLQQTERIENVESLAIKDKEELAVPTWSTDDSVVPLTPKTESPKKNAAAEKLSAVKEETVPPAVTIQPEVEPPKSENEPVQVASANFSPEEITEAVTAETTQNIPEEIVPPAVTPEPEVEPPKSEEKRISYGSTLAQAASKRDFSIPLIAAAVVVSAIAGISLSVWLLGSESPTVITDQSLPTTNDLVATDGNLNVPIGISNTALLESIAITGTNNNANIITLQPSHSAGPATLEEILTVLNWRAPGAFIRNIDNLTFGYYKSQSPYIVLKVTSFETGYGGMLNWESDMSADLSPLFGPIVSETFDPTSRTSTQTRPAFFIDKAVGVLDVRILKDEKAVDRIAYTFIDQNTILITDSVAALEEILPYIK